MKNMVEKLKNSIEELKEKAESYLLETHRKVKDVHNRSIKIRADQPNVQTSE